MWNREAVPQGYNSTDTPGGRPSPTPGSRGRYAYTAFISYSHAADGTLAPRLQSGLHRFAKPWYRLRAMRVFRDETSLSNTHELRASIERALDGAEYFLLLASPRSAASPWVKKEIAYWMSKRPKDKVLFLLTDGDLQWDESQRTFDWTKTSALPRDIDYPFDDVPRYTDLRALRGLPAADLSLRNPVFLQAVADIASTLLGKDKDVLLGEDVREHRRTKRITWAAALMLLVLTLASIVAATVAVRNQREAEERRRLAQSRVLAAQARDQVQGERLDVAALLGLEAYDPPYTYEARNSLLSTFAAAARVITTLRGHDGGVDAVAFSPKGGRLATAGGGTIRLWNASTFEPIGEPLEDHGDAIFALAFSPDGNWLVSGSRSDQQLLLWDLANTKPVPSPLTGHRGSVAVSGVAFSPDGRLLASAGGDNIILLWDVTTRQPLGEPLPGHEGFVESVAFSPDGHWVASGSQDRTAKLWDVQTRELQFTLPDHGAQVQAVAFSPDGALLATASASKIVLWEVPTGRMRGHALEHDARVDTVAFSPDGRLLVSAGSGSDAATLWDVERQEVAAPALRTHTSWISDVAFGPDGTLASASPDGSTILWNLHAPPPLGMPLAPGIGRVSSMAIAADGATIAAGGCAESQSGSCRENHIWLWNRADGRLAGEPLSDHSAAIQDLIFSADGARLSSSACYLEDGACAGVEIRVWQTNHPGAVGEPVRFPAGRVERSGFSPDGKWLAVAQRFSDDAEIRVINTQNGRPLDVLFTGLRGIVRDIFFSPDARRVAASALNGAAMLWDTTSGLPLFDPMQGDLLAFAPGGKTIVTVHKENPTADPVSLLVWDAATGQRTRLSRTDYFETLLKVALSADGGTLAAGGYDGTVMLWDMRSDQLLGILKGASDAIVQIAFTPDSQTLVTGNGSGTVMLWDLGFETWRRRACSIANRNLSYAEWLQYRGDEPYRKTCEEGPVHPSLLEAARARATAGDVGGAVELFNRAITLDTGLARSLNPETEARRLAVDGLVERGRSVAKAGNVDAAIPFFERARELDPQLKLNPIVEAGKAAAPALVTLARLYAERGMIEQARERYDRALVLDPQLLIAANDWSVLCWSAIVNHRAALGYPACDRAVKAASEFNNYQDVRGMARALTGNTPGAVEDLQAYLDWWERTTPRRGGHGNQLRTRAEIDTLRDWIEALKKGLNPFTPEELERLHSR